MRACVQTGVRYVQTQERLRRILRKDALGNWISPKYQTGLVNGVPILTYPPKTTAADLNRIADAIRAAGETGVVKVEGIMPGGGKYVASVAGYVNYEEDGVRTWNYLDDGARRVKIKLPADVQWTYDGKPVLDWLERFPKNVEVKK